MPIAGLCCGLRLSGPACASSTARVVSPWGTRGEDCWTTVADLADRGILVAPGEFYGARGSEYVRVALTATDERIAQVPGRLSR